MTWCNKFSKSVYTLQDGKKNIPNVYVSNTCSVKGRRLESLGRLKSSSTISKWEHYHRYFALTRCFGWRKS